MPKYTKSNVASLSSDDEDVSVRGLELVLVPDDDEEDHVAAKESNLGDCFDGDDMDSEFVGVVEEEE